MFRELRWAIAGFLTGVLIAVSPSCGTGKPPCDATQCQGCCDASGACQIGVLASSCGQRGAACSSCADGQICHVGACVTPNPNSKGGDTPLDAGGSCGPANCAGCCRAGECIIPSDTTASCGTGGAGCWGCVGHQTCTNGECTDPGCNGCVDQVGGCHPGDTLGACGTGGRSCSSCASGQTCQSGVCTGGTGLCNVTTCATGCCQGGTCVPQSEQSVTRCGTGGETCTGCGTGWSCEVGKCTGQQGVCTTQNCADGCCIDNGCVVGDSPSACGMPQSLCQACSASQGCLEHQCVTTQVGSGCQSDGDCASLGQGAFCKKQTATGLGTYTGGYCSLRCNDGICPLGSTCVSQGAPYDEPAPFCARGCSPPASTSSTDCRKPGYFCLNLNNGSTSGVCFIYPPPQVVLDGGPTSGGGDGGSLGDKAGAACTMDSQCQGPSDAFCWKDGDGGAPGGSCTLYCGANADRCGDAGICFGEICWMRCNTSGGQGSCRSSYLCATDDDGLLDAGLDGGLCVPRCDSPGWGCPDGSVCGGNGGCS